MRKNKISRLAAIFLAVSLFIFPARVYADGPVSAVIIAEDVDQGDTLTVRIAIGKNDGIISGSLNVVYDNTKLVLTEASAETELMKGVLYALNDKYSDNCVRISFASGSDFRAEGGDIMVLSFTALESGNAEFTVENLKLRSDAVKYETADTKKTVTVNKTEGYSVSEGTAEAQSADTQSEVDNADTKKTVTENKTEDYSVSEGTAEAQPADTQSEVDNAEIKNNEPGDTSYNAPLLFIAIAAAMVVIAVLTVTVIVKKSKKSAK